MRGKTHLAAGVACAAALLRPGDMASLAGGLTAAAIGGVIPDVDLASSGAGKDVIKILGLVVLAFGTLLLIDRRLGIGITEECAAVVTSSKGGLACVFMLMLCAAGAISKHRSFTHSFLGLALFTGCAAFLSKPMSRYFLAGYASHLALDFLNKKGIMLMYPFGQAASLKVCKSDGAGDVILFAGAVAAAAIVISSLPVIGSSLAVIRAIPEGINNFFHTAILSHLSF